MDLELTPCLTAKSSEIEAESVCLNIFQQQCRIEIANYAKHITLPQVLL